MALLLKMILSKGRLFLILDTPWEEMFVLSSLMGEVMQMSPYNPW